ncbi:hypothetical protein [Nonomuraea sp. GTA35]|uniref:hypothetical protein n=1 Tax=Nonomuraea sp. GTA35 TaxID=1676746 RepID=UPI0035C161B0
MTDWTIERTAEVLLEAERDRADRGPNTAEWPGLDLATAYRAQQAVPPRRGSPVTVRFAGLGGLTVAGV